MGNNKKIAIFGQYKTGTTALFYKLSNSLPAEINTLFEPDENVPIPKEDGKYLLAKVIIRNTDELKLSSFTDFSKQIYIVRDPRDWVISMLLFQVQQVPECYMNLERLKSIMDILRLKEIDPQRVSILQIMRLIFGIKSDGIESIGEWIMRMQDRLVDFESQFNGVHVVRYEDFVDNKLKDLEAYLELPLTGNADVGHVHNHVVRTKAYGNWRQWFHDEDIDFFQPIIQNYIDRHSYDAGWELSSKPSIKPEHCSSYVARTVRMRLDPFLEEVLKEYEPRTEKMCGSGFS